MVCPKQNIEKLNAGFKQFQLVIGPDEAQIRIKCYTCYKAIPYEFLEEHELSCQTCVFCD